MTKTLSVLLPLVVGLAVGYLLAHSGAPASSVTAAEQGPPKPPDLNAVAADLKVALGKLPDKSHAMTDVAMQFSNCWFAGEHENWPLADFFYSETKSHLAWAVRIIPKRKDNAGKEIDLPAILQSLENSPLKQLGEAIKQKDKTAFEKAYKFTLDGCYSCHKAADKPYLRPQIPTQPALPIINFDPNADWPK